MKKRIFDQRGISLIEVITASAIISIVALAAGSFLLTNLFSYNAASNNITLEREGRASLNAIADKVRESSSVDSVGTDKGGTPGDELDRTGIQNVYSLNLSDGARLAVERNKLNLSGTTSGTTLSYSLDTDGLKIEPLPEGLSFRKCTGLRIKLTLKKENNKYNIESEAYFRNSK